MNVVAKKHEVWKLSHSSPLSPACFSARLCLTGSSIRCAVVQIWEWQVMQVAVGGKPACGAVSDATMAVAAIDTKLSLRDADG